MLSDAELAKVNAGHYTAAFLWHTSSDFTVAVQAGAEDEFTRLGISVVATTDAGFSAAKQTSDVETVVARKPSVIIALPLDPTISAESFRPALQAGTRLVFLSNVPDGYRHGTDYVSIVTDDLFQIAALRRGVHIGVRDTRQSSHNEIVSMITGLQSADATPTNAAENVQNAGKTRWPRS